MTTDPAAIPRPGVRFPLYFFEWFAILQVLAVQGMIYAFGYSNGGWYALWMTARMFGGALMIEVAVGIAARSAWALYRRDWGYFRVISSMRWILLTLRILISGLLVIHGYAWLKVLVPVFNASNWDASLWDVDRALFFGYSPNVLFLNLFSNPTLLRFIDWSYGQAFLATLGLSVAIFVTLADDRVRIAYASGNAVLWTAGAWLYLLLPSLGPCYRFPEVWDSVANLLTDSRKWQAILWKNYSEVIRLQPKYLQPNARIAFGIAAFPSLHVGFQLFVALWVGYLSRYAGIFFRLGVMVIFLGSIVTGWHYMIDSLAGALMAILCYAVTRRIYSIGEPSTAGPSAVTAP